MGLLPKGWLLMSESTCFIIDLRTSSLGGDTTHSDLGLPTSVINQKKKKWPIGFPAGQSGGGIL